MAHSVVVDVVSVPAPNMFFTEKKGENDSWCQFRKSENMFFSKMELLAQSFRKSE